MKKTRLKIIKISQNIIQLIKKRYKLLLILLLIIVGIGFWYYRRVQANKVELKFAHPVKQDLTKTLDVSGIIDAEEKATMRFIAGGKIVYIGAQEGDWVKKGQTLATIDQADLQKRLEKDLNLYMKERWDWDQQLDDIKDRWIDKEEQRTVDKNHWDLENTVIDVEIRDIAIKNTVLSAPFEGILVSSPVTSAPVQVLSTDTWELINPNTLLFRAEVDEEDIGAVMIDQVGKLTLDAYPDEILTTQVAYISFQSSQSSTGTVFAVEFPLQGITTLNKYRLGMNGDIAIELETHYDVLTIPLIALKEREGKTYVDVKTGEDSYEEREIKIGLETDEKVEVIAGLSENDEVLVPE
ncbi:MAG: efflux RND transporter periplasmic adaptor subunit [Candidatus Pacebacteria bacterium]|nr:efflux RND transporter periplasmic adaptor subunit [Candidatus Paceibacterota bacterium]